MVKLRVERTIAASPERVFDWLADLANLTAAPRFCGPASRRARRGPAWAHCGK